MGSGSCLVEPSSFEFVAFAARSSFAATSASIIDCRPSLDTAAAVVGWECFGLFSSVLGRGQITAAGINLLPKACSLCSAVPRLVGEKLRIRAGRGHLLMLAWSLLVAVGALAAVAGLRVFERATAVPGLHQ